MELSIDRFDEALRVSARGSRGEQTAPRTLGGVHSVPELQRFAGSVGQAAQRGKPLSNALAAEAQALWQALLDGEAGALCAKLRAASDGPLLVRWMVHAPELQAVPWEALGRSASSAEVLPVRGVASTDPCQAHEVRGAVRVLAVAPQGGSGSLKDALAARVAAKEVEWLDPVEGTAAGSRYLLARLRREPVPHVLHFIGHGGLDEQGRPVLRLADEDGEEVWLPVALLGDQLAAGARGVLRLVVLETCEGAKPSPSAFASAAEMLARAGADAVVAHLWPVKTDVARACSTHLYRALAGAGPHSGDVAWSMNEARRALLGEFGESAEALSPVLYLRGPDGALFDFTGKQHEPVLISGTSPLPKKAGAAALLNARHEVVPFYGRVDLLEDMWGWCEGGDNIGVRLVHAAGGMGKTRFAIELCRRMRRRGWRAGFLKESDGLGALMQSERPVLAVLDYAESRPLLGDMLARVAGHDSNKLRLLLLARNADAWWRDLGQRDGLVGDLLKQEEPLELVPVTEDKGAIFNAAVMAFAGRQYQGPSPSLADARYERVLYVHAAALATAKGREVKINALMEDTLDHEERFWREQIERDDVDDMRKVVAALTLKGGAASKAEAGALVKLITGGPDKKMVQLLHDLYPGRDLMYVAGLEPDLLGEAMVWRVLNGEKTGAGAYLDQVFEGVDIAAIRTGFTVLGRLSEDHKEAAGWIARVLNRDVVGRAMEAFAAAKLVGERTAHAAIGMVLAAALEREGTAELAERLEEELPHPYQTVSLREVGQWVVAERLAHLPEGMDEERARLLNNLSGWQSALGQRKAALASTQEAVDILRKLAQARPEAFLPNLARSLHNLGARQSALGQREAALASTQEALDAIWPFFLRLPAAFERDTADYLHNLRKHLEALGRPPPALLVEREATFAARRSSGGGSAG
jgi:CHAT domain